MGQKVETSLLGAIVAVESQNWAVMTNPDTWIGFEVVGAKEEPKHEPQRTTAEYPVTLSRNRGAAMSQKDREVLQGPRCRPERPEADAQAGNSFEKGEDRLER